MYLSTLELGTNFTTNACLPKWRRYTISVFGAMHPWQSSHFNIKLKKETQKVNTYFKNKYL